MAEIPTEGIPGLKQGRDACDVFYHGHGKSLEDAFALGLAVALPAIHADLRERLLSRKALEAAAREVVEAGSSDGFYDLLGNKEKHHLRDEAHMAVTAALDSLGLGNEDTHA